MEPKKGMLSPEELKNAVGGIKGFPDGEFKDGEVVCPFCTFAKVALYDTFKVDSFQSPWTDSVVKDKTVECYICPACRGKFLHYGNFYEFFDKGDV